MSPSSSVMVSSVVTVCLGSSFEVDMCKAEGKNDDNEANMAAGVKGTQTRTWKLGQTMLLIKVIGVLARLRHSNIRRSSVLLSEFTPPAAYFIVQGCHECHTKIRGAIQKR